MRGLERRERERPGLRAGVAWLQVQHLDELREAAQRPVRQQLARPGDEGVGPGPRRPHTAGP